MAKLLAACAAVPAAVANLSASAAASAAPWAAAKASAAVSAAPEAVWNTEEIWEVCSLTVPSRVLTLPPIPFTLVSRVPMLLFTSCTLESTYFLVP